MVDFSNLFMRNLGFIDVGILTRLPKVLCRGLLPNDLHPPPHPHPTPNLQVLHHWISLVSRRF